MNREQLWHETVRDALHMGKTADEAIALGEAIVNAFDVKFGSGTQQSEDMTQLWENAPLKPQAYVDTTEQIYGGTYTERNRQELRRFKLQVAKEQQIQKAAEFLRGTGVTKVND